MTLCCEDWGYWITVEWPQVAPSLFSHYFHFFLFFSDQLRPFLDESAGGFVERLFEAVEESKNSRGNKGGAERNRKRDLKVSLCSVYQVAYGPTSSLMCVDFQVFSFHYHEDHKLANKFLAHHCLYRHCTTYSKNKVYFTCTVHLTVTKALLLGHSPSEQTWMPCQFMQHNWSKIAIIFVSKPTTVDFIQYADLKL